MIISRHCQYVRKDQNYVCLYSIGIDMYSAEYKYNNIMQYIVSYTTLRCCKQIYKTSMNTTNKVYILATRNGETSATKKPTEKRKYFNNKKKYRGVSYLCYSCGVMMFVCGLVVQIFVKPCIKYLVFLILVQPNHKPTILWYTGLVNNSVFVLIS